MEQLTAQRDKLQGLCRALQAERSGSLPRAAMPPSTATPSAVDAAADAAPKDSAETTTTTTAAATVATDGGDAAPAPAASGEVDS
jgi:hypothetical protein